MRQEVRFRQQNILVNLSALSNINKVAIDLDIDTPAGTEGGGGGSAGEVLSQSIMC